MQEYYFKHIVDASLQATLTVGSTQYSNLWNTLVSQNPTLFYSRMSENNKLTPVVVSDESVSSMDYVDGSESGTLPANPFCCDDPPTW